MNNKIGEIIKKYFTLLHIIGIVFGFLLSFFYWYKSGRYSDNIFRNNIIIILAWGILSGYFVCDIINTVRINRKKDSCQNNKN
jgi:hypothetical protein